MRPSDATSPSRNYNPPRVVEPPRERIRPETEPVAFRTRAYEQDFAARYTAARLNFRPEPEPPAPAPSTASVTTSGSGTETTYRTGAPARPNVRHDNGFLQNPNNPLDPNPIPTTAPTQSDLDFYESEKFRAAGAQIADNLWIPFRDEDDTARRLQNGIEAYRHFLENDGADRNFSYDEFVSEDANGRVALNNAIADTQRGAEQIYSRMVAENPSLANQPVTFEVTSGAIGVGSTEENAPFPYPATENWQKAIGGHSIWNSATVTVTPPTEPGGEPQFSMDYTLHAEDRYNFNPDQEDIATGQPDAIRGLQLEQTGLAHQYMQYGTAERDVTWTRGDITTTTSTANPNEGR